MFEDGWVSENIPKTLLEKSIYQFWPMFDLGKRPKTEAQGYQWHCQKVLSQVHFHHGQFWQESSSTHLPIEMLTLQATQWRKSSNINVKIWWSWKINHVDHNLHNSCNRVRESTSTNRSITLAIVSLKYSKYKSYQPNFRNIHSQLLISDIPIFSSTKKDV